LACRKLEKSFGKEIHKKIHGTYQLLRENYSGSYPTQAKIKLSKNHSSLLNPVYSSYKKVLTYAEIILKDLDLEHSTTEQSQHTHGYLFDISQLFEVYLEKLLSRKFSDWLVSGQEEIIVYPSPLFYRRKMFPDIVMRHNYTGKVIVFDAKFKKMSFRKNDLDRGDFYQIHSYIQYYQSEVILGGLIYPLSKELCKRKTYSNSIFGKKTTDQFFIVEGIYVDETMEMSKIIENEEKFIFRIQETIDAIFQENSSLNSIKL
jgi:5-methylcytosine-specific restriction endonuclease McrBC regulatory subunit McrC